MTVDDTNHQPDEWIEPEYDPAAEEEAMEQHRRSFERLRRAAPERVVIMLQRDIDVGGYADTLEERLPPDVQEAWYALIGDKERPAGYEPTIRRLFRDVESADDRLLPELLTYYEVLLPRERDEALAFGRRLTRRLREYDHVIRSIYIESPPAPPPLAPCGGRVRNYMGAAPNGMNVNRFRPAAGGEWPTVIDMEWVWNKAQSHSDLAMVTVVPGFEGPSAAQYGPDYAADSRHATGVLGILGAGDSAGGPRCPGMIPGPKVKFASAWLLDPDWRANIASRIKSIADPLNGHMEPGDILLLELQTWGVYTEFLGGGATQALDVLSPVELEGHIATAIRQAVAFGVIVIEAAGNGAEGTAAQIANGDPLGKELSHLKTYDGLAGFSQPTGAILVAACGAFGTTIHKPWKLSNFGDAVVCYAYGQNVHTLDANNPAGMWPFGNTSAASALVAGVAALVQNAAMRDLGRCLTVAEMRKALTCLNTVPGPADGQRIGVMPNLEVIVDTYLTTL